MRANVVIARQDNFDFHFSGTSNDRIEVVDFKPQKHAISVWLNTWVADGTMVMLHFPTVQLQNELAVRDQPFIFGATMRALPTEKMLIPATARFNITHANKGLRMHRNSGAGLLFHG